jgi:hypothetical protein
VEDFCRASTHMVSKDHVDPAEVTDLVDQFDTLRKATISSPITDLISQLTSFLYKTFRTSREGNFYETPHSVLCRVYSIVLYSVHTSGLKFDFKNVA